MKLFYKLSTTCTLIILLVTLSSSLFGQDDKEYENIGYWSFCDKYTFKYLVLKDDNSFYRCFRSCNGEHIMTGTYVSIQDSIILYDDEKDKELVILERDGKLFDYSGEDGEYPDFQPLERTKKRSKKKALNKCAKSRKYLRRHRRK